LIPRSGNVFYRPVSRSHAAVDHPRFVETLRLQVVHQVVGVIRCGMADSAFGLAEENLLAPELRFGRLFRDQLAVNIQFRSRRKSNIA